MGEGSAQTVAEIEDTRTRLGQEVDELQRRLPSAGTMKKAGIAAAAVGGTGATSIWVLRRRRKKRREQARATAVVHVVPDEWGNRLNSALAGGEWKPWVIGGAVVWVFLRLAEIRYLRRLNRATFVRAAA